jgi:hypothetical protein
MTHRSAEKLLEIVETIASGVLSPRKAAKRCGIPPSTYWDWVAASQRSDERFLVEYCGEVMQFAKAVGLARKIALTDALGEFETRLLTGDSTPVFFQGRPSFVEDEALSTWSDSDLERLGIPDRYLRDKQRRRVQHTIKTPPPIQAVVKMLEANFKQYRPRSETSLSIDQKFSGGVHVVNVNKPAHSLPVVEIVPPALPPPVEVSVPQPVEEHLAEPVPTASNDAVEPPTYQPRAKGVTDLERDLLNRLKTPPTNPRPSAPVNVGKPSDEH